MFLLRGVRLFVLAGLVAFAGYRAAALVEQAGIFRIDRIVIQGNRRLAHEQVLGQLQGLRGQNILGVRLEAWRQRLRESPWINDAALRRVLPSTIEVTVTEREPIGLGRMSGTLYLVDGSGAVIAEYGPDYADLDLPIVDGLASPTPAGHPMVDDARARLAGQLLAALRSRKDLARRVSQVDVSDPQDAVVVLSGDTALLHLGNDRFVERLQSYLELASALRARVAEIDYVDLRFGDRVYVKPAGAHEGLLLQEPAAAPTASRGARF